jgi:hypothetical protein
VDSRSQFQFNKWMSDGFYTISKHMPFLKKSLTLIPSPALPRFSPYEPTPARTSSTSDRLEHTLSSSSSVVDLMLKAFRRMVNLTEYELEWRDLPVTQDTRAFLYGIPHSNHLSGLRKLVLHGQLVKLHQLLPSCMYKFSSLQELELHFEYDTPTMFGAPSSFDITRSINRDQAILHQTVAPFIASLGPSLSALTISSSVECNHAYLFNSSISEAGHCLRRLSLCISYDTGRLSDTAGLVRLLRAHAGTLLHVEFREAGGREMAPTSRELEAWSILNRACLDPSAADDIYWS